MYPYFLELSAETIALIPWTNNINATTVPTKFTNEAGLIASTIPKTRLISANVIVEYVLYDVVRCINSPIAETPPATIKTHPMKRIIEIIAPLGFAQIMMPIIIVKRPVSIIPHFIDFKSSFISNPPIL